MSADPDGYYGSNPRQGAARRNRLEAFGRTDDPPTGVQCDLLCEDHVGTYELPYPCVWTNETWTSVATGERVDARVVAWRLTGEQRRS